LTIPSIEDFQAFWAISLSAVAPVVVRVSGSHKYRVCRGEAIERVSSTDEIFIPTLDMLEDVEEYVQETVARFEATSSQLNNSAVGLWLRGQECFERAMHLKHYKRTSKPNRDTSFKSDSTLASELAQLAAKGTNDLMVRVRSLTPVNFYLCEVTEALAQYLHRPELAAQAVQERRLLPQKLEAARRCIAELSKSLRCIAGAGDVNAVVMYRRISRAVEILKAESAGFKFDDFPIKNVSANVSERHLVTRLARINKRHLGSARPSVIAELMQLEGIRRPMEQEEIRALCKSRRELE
jgi:hypothetical protein